MSEMYHISRLLDEFKVVIPEIQRDYAHGRTNETASSVRRKLLSDIFNTLSSSNPECQLVLNYIYGVPKESELILIDGQQRITTLYLLKWYLAVKANADLGFLGQLEYATRETSKEFREFLSEANNGECIKQGGKPSNAIKNHTAFRKKWLYDPTINSMLNMVDAIAEEDERHTEVPVSEKYNNLARIRFSFISLEGFTRIEDLYAAMNSRGKQLTSFELIKGQLLKIEPTLSTQINGRWIPTFWKLARTFSRTDKLKRALTEEAFAAAHHDQFLYNYYSFVTQMLWWQKHPEEERRNKSNEIPSISVMTDDVYSSDNNIDFLKYSFELVNKSFSQLETNTFSCLTRDTKTHQNANTVLLFDGNDSDSVDFFKLCCYGGSQFTNPGKCYLWAYLKYCWDESKKNAAGRLIDYFILARSLFMAKSSNATPTSVGKNSLNEPQLGSVIIPFCRITEGQKDAGNLPHYRVFYSDDSQKYLLYQVLNNPLVRGCTENVLGNNDSPDKLERLSKNLNWIWENLNSDKADTVFAKFYSFGFAKMKCELNGYDGRVFLPVSKKMLQSVFSIRGWKESKDFIRLLNELKTTLWETRESIIPRPNQGEYYVWKYASFRAGSYGLFAVSGNNMELFNASFIEGERATKHKTRDPFAYEVYNQCKELSKTVLPNLSYGDFKGKTGLRFSHTDAGYQWDSDIHRELAYTIGSDVSIDIIDAYLHENRAALLSLLNG